MAAHEQQNERVVGVRDALICWGLRDSLGWQQPLRNRLLPALAGLLTSQQVRQATRCDRDQPAERVIGTTLSGPAGRGGDERLLRRVLGGIEVAVATNQRAEHPRREIAQQVLYLGVRQ